VVGKAAWVFAVLSCDARPAAVEPTTVDKTLELVCAGQLLLTPAAVGCACEACCVQNALFAASSGCHFCVCVRSCQGMVQSS
jgi:hypothetical protein